MTYLDRVLTHLGYAHRPQQDALFEHLLTLDREPPYGVVAQAGTGTGKSIAVLAAAAHIAQAQLVPSLVVCPTNILMDQYVAKDAPAVEAALGVKIRALKGRNRYLCASAPGWMSEPNKVPIYGAMLTSGDVHEVQDSRWGCPGSDVCDRNDVCHYRLAKDRLEDADIIVTNAHLLIIDNQMKAAGPGLNEEGEETASPRIFPDLGAVFVDEAHTLEEVARGFTENSLSLAVVDTMGEHGVALADMMRRWEREVREPKTIGPHQIPYLATALRPLSHWKPADGERPNQRRADAAASARGILLAGERGAFADGHRVLWFDPQRPPRSSRIVGTDVNLAGMMRSVLTTTPFALVSATVPRTMAQALGVPEARFIDVGHPFDYSRQARLGFSAYSGDFRSAQSTFAVRADELKQLILERRGGALVLFSAFRDLEAVYQRIATDLRRSGLLVLKQDGDADKADLGRRFVADGNAVLFGSASFATGFDVPGPALRLLAVWKLAYPGLDPVTRAISDASRQRYEDMMLVSTVQAIGRLIRTSTDYGDVWIADSRGRNKLLAGNDPMTSHLREFAPL